MHHVTALGNTASQASWQGACWPRGKADMSKAEERSYGKSIHAPPAAVPAAVAWSGLTSVLLCAR